MPGRIVVFRSSDDAGRLGGHFALPKPRPYDVTGLVTRNEVLARTASTARQSWRGCSSPLRSVAALCWPGA